MIKCIIIEDQPPAQRVLQKFILDHGGFKLEGIFTNTSNVPEFLLAHEIDLIFLDVHLPQKSGVEFLKTAKNIPNVIMTTAFTEYAVQGFELNVVDYLVKPFSFDRFKQAIDKVEDKTNKDNQDFIFIKSGHEFVKLDISAISHINSDMDYTEVHINDKKHLTNETLSAWSSKLADKNFVRIHKSYLVNLAHVQKVKGNKLYLENETILPIGRAYKEELMKSYIQQ